MLAHRIFISLATTSSLVAGCGDDDGPLEPTYANVERVVARSCTFGSTCHGGARGQAHLNFQRFGDAGDPITMAFQNADGTPRPSCEYDLMPVVDPGDPDNSWLVVKLEGTVAADDRLDFAPDPGWVPDMSDPSCPHIEDMEITFGIPMPFSASEPKPLPERERTMFREWIAMGAPGPE